MPQSPVCRECGPQANRVGGAGAGKGGRGEGSGGEEETSQRDRPSMERYAAKFMQFYRYVGYPLST